MIDTTASKRPRSVGSRVRRLDALEKATGRARYGTELHAPEMLHARIFRSERPHARILRLDTSGAEAMPGVIALVTAADAPGLHGMLFKEQPVFASDRVRYIGEPIAAVAAETAELAEAALASIVVEYEDLPAVLDLEAALQPRAPLVHDDLGAYGGPPDRARGGNICCSVLFERGDVARALGEADVVVEGTYTTTTVHQSPLEPRVAMAEVDANSRVTVWSSSQSPFGMRAALAGVMQVPLTQVRVVGTQVGGGFGSKIELVVEHVAALLARKARRPVKCVLSREEELAYGMPRRPFRVKVRSGVKRDGTLVAREVTAHADEGAYTGDAPIILAVAAHMGTGPYRVPDARVEVLGVLTNTPSRGSYRAPGGPQMVFAIEAHMDAIAAELGMDPLDLRLKNAWEDGDVAINGQVLRNPAVREALERASDAIGWRRGETSVAVDGKLRGKGLACGWWCTAGGGSAATMRLNEDGTVTVVSGAAEIGSGSVTALAQFAADALDVPFEQVRVVIGDTDSAPYDMGALGSRTTFNQGNAIRLASDDLAGKMYRLASTLLEVAPDDLELADGSVRVRGAAERAVSYAQIGEASQNQGGPLIGSGSYVMPQTPHDPEAVHGCLMPSWTSPSYFCHAAEVEVDTETGQVRVLDYAAAHDLGTVVNPIHAEGQLQGAAVQGYGMALTEHMEFDDGSLQQRDWSLYKLPTALEAPRVRTILLEHPDADGPLGAKGVGEGPIVPPPATIANAVAAATGVRLTSLPIEAETLLRALEVRS
jgi:CO/xanthine dehydrogenase Mo-binding subunit